MNKIIERFSSETGKNEKFEYIEIEEQTTVKGDNFLVSHEYYRRLSDGELFEPFENPDKNLEKDYNLYREKYNLLSSEAVKKIRNKYKMTITDYGAVLGISYSNLSSIENGSIQSKYIDSLIRLSEDPSAFKKLVESRKNDLTDENYLRITDTIDKLSTFSIRKTDKMIMVIIDYNIAAEHVIVRVTDKLNYKAKKISDEGDKQWTESAIISSKQPLKMLTSK